MIGAHRCEYHSVPALELDVRFGFVQATARKPTTIISCTRSHGDTYRALKHSTIYVRVNISWNGLLHSQSQ
jgi:hypothetical protein